jgi:replicative DNA helicase
MWFMPDQALLLRPAEAATRALPANIEAEAAFLGAALIDNPRTFL